MDQKSTIETTKCSVAEIVESAFSKPPQRATRGYGLIDSSVCMRISKDSYLLYIENVFDEEHDLSQVMKDVIETPVRNTKEKAIMGHFKPRDERSFDWSNTSDSTFDYGGQKYISHPATAEETKLSIDLLEIIKRVIDNTSGVLGFDLESLVPDQGVNIHYSETRHAGGSVAKHRDDEDDWPVVAVLTFGQTRAFKITSNNGKKKYCVLPKHNSLLVMIGKNFQNKFMHEVPKFTKATPIENIGSRVSWNIRYKIK